ncbi:MAG TPA: AraC family transcriptional regulator [Isosphaeraceae bacterium]|jgi:AraC family transcriptional regulator|nr:AraC family transcriptional regulator [Isosphaeraceae bacterium]
MEPVRKVLWFVESYSRTQITLEDISQACKVSPFHLTRTFAATMGISLMRYVRGRRLTEAARSLAQGADDILRVALNAGYGSHEAFTRAFRDQFGLTPEKVRDQGHLNNLSLVEAILMTPTPTADIAPARFETKDSVQYAGLVERYACEAPQGIAGQWQRFSPYLGRLSGQVGKVAYGVVYNFDSDSNFDYMCGVEHQKTAPVPEGLQALQVPRQKYAVFVHPGHVAGIRGTLSAIWSKWLPESGHQAAEAPTLERYGPEFNPVTGMGGFEIWLPIQE